MNNKSTHKKGFTLVELSIVLVIIGLLIGGILVAQSLIESAKISSFVRTIGQYDVGISLYEDRFKSIPADDNLFFNIPRTGATAAGDGEITAQNSNDDDFDEETAYFWQAMSASGMIDENYVNNGFPIAGESIPKLEISDAANAGILVGNPTEGGESFLNENVYWLTSPSATESIIDGACVDCSYALKPLVALSLDSKIDDGLPKSGNMTSASNREFGGPFVSSSCHSTTEYTASRDDNVCSVKIKILATTAN